MGYKNCDIFILMNPEELTIKNLEIAKKFVESSNSFAEGVFLSGSNAWGANYAVNKNSDIDLIIIVKEIEQIGQIIEKYTEEGLVGIEQKNRFEIFQILHTNKKADTFSFRISNNNTWVGIDFIPFEIVERITKFKSMETVICEDDKGNINLRIINEFRSNPPKKDGYSVDGLTETRKLVYHPKFENIKSYGCVSQTLVDGIDERNTMYFLGVISFFFAIEPVILFDKEGQLAECTKIFQSNIKGRLNSQIPMYITRQERMSDESLNRIKNLFV